MTESLSSAFYALPADVREAAKERACEKYGADDFFDLEPEQRSEAYAEALHS